MGTGWIELPKILLGSGKLLFFLSTEKFPNNKTKTKTLSFKVGPLKNKYSTFPAVKVAILSISGPAHLEK